MTIILITAAVTAGVTALSAGKGEWTFTVCLGAGLAAAGAFVFIFLGFDSMKGFMNKP